eukprot:968240-Prymnesium_polylepis.2
MDRDVKARISTSDVKAQISTSASATQSIMTLQCTPQLSTTQCAVRARESSAGKGWGGWRDGAHRPADWRALERVSATAI